MARINSHLLQREEWNPFVDRSVVFVGGNGDDIWPPPLQTTNGNDSLRGLDGNDVLDGGAGDDIIDGGNDQDIIHGGTGNDILYGGVGDDRIYAGTGADTIYGDGGHDMNYGLTTGNDNIYLSDPRVLFVNGGDNGLDYIGLDFRTSTVGAIADFGGFSLSNPYYSFVHVNNGDTTGNIAGIDRFEFFYGSIYDDVLNMHDYLYDLTFFNSTNPELPQQGGTGVDGNAGNDIIYGGRGNDVLNGGADNDQIHGSYGNDRIDGSTGDDAIFGDSGNDTLFGSEGSDSIEGDGGDDTISGGEGNDTLKGGTGINILNGGDGGDDLEDNGGASGTTLNGGDGDDFLYSEVMTTVYDGGAGYDVLSIDLDESAPAQSLDFRTFVSGGTFALGSGSVTNVEWITSISVSSFDDTIYLGDDTGGTSLLGDAGADTFFGNASSNYMNGGTGNDILNGNGGGDTLQGSVGDDTLNGGPGDDYMVGDEFYTPGTAPYAGNDLFYVDSPGDIVIESIGGGNDRVLASASYTLGAGQEIEKLEAITAGGTAALNFTGNAFAQTIIGNAGLNVIIGGGGNDYLVGLGGDDVLVGNSDAGSTLEGGTGNDTFYVSRTGDSVIEAAGQGNDKIRTSVSFTLGDGQEIETLSALDPAATTHIDLTGNTLAQIIIGNAGANVLISGGGNDYLVGAGGDDILVGNSGTASTLQGGTGNDWYYITRTGDSLVEFAGEGNDRILTSVSYTLSAGQEVETLSALDPVATTTLGLTGNALSQAINGNAGANVLTGGGGSDSLVGLGGDDILIGNADAASTLQGGTGNDWYYVSRTGDSIVELGGEGNDRIISSVSYTLSAGVEIETLLAANQSGTAAIDLIGNDFGQAIYGTNGANGMSGNGGADQLAGFGGDDILLGGEGDDQLNGGAGHDVLNGGNGADLFVFADALGVGNVDIVQDFTSGSDRIAIDHNIFTGLSNGLLPASAFVAGTAAQDADDRIIYNQATGELWFDADGNGAGAALLFATLAPATALTAADIVVI